MAKGQREIGRTMRPNIRISHQLNGRVKDFAAAQGLDVNDAYKAIILAGLDELEGADSDKVQSFLNGPA